jgi:hypothetical protein
VVAWNGGYVAVGSFQNSRGGSQAEAWTSPDWRSWTRTFLDAPAAGDSGLNRVLAVGGRLVAVGTSGEPACTGPAGAGQLCRPAPVAIWTSLDGRRWERAANPAPLAGVAVDAVAANGSLLVLAGNTDWGRPVILTSADGVVWSRASLLGSPFAEAHFAGLAATPVSFVLTGSTGGRQPTGGVSGNNGSTPAAWLSADGLSWAPAAVDGATEDSGDLVGQVFVGGAGLRAWAGHDASFGWSSRDGTRWSALPKPFGYPVVPRASDGRHIVGDSYGDGGGEAFWVSADGVAWQPLAAVGAVDQMPSWDGSGSTADAAFLFPTGLGLIGRNGTDRFPLWFAEGSPGS